MRRCDPGSTWAAISRSAAGASAGGPGVQPANASSRWASSAHSGATGRDEGVAAVAGGRSSEYTSPSTFERSMPTLSAFVARALTVRWPFVDAVHPTAQFTASPFSRLAVAHTLTVAGDTLVTTALAGSLFFDISPNAARGKVALSLALSMAPFAVVAPFLGPAIDRVRGGRRLTMAVAAALRAVTCLFMARVLDGLLLFPAAFASLVLSKTHAVAKSSLVPTVVASDDDLVMANARLSLAGVVVGLVAAAPGVAVLKLAGAEWVVRLAAVVFVAASVASLRIVTRRPDEPKAAAAGGAELREAGIRTAAVAMAVLRGSVGFLTFLIAFALRREHAPAWVFGVALLASMGGSLAGSVLAPVVRRRMREERLLMAALALLGTGALVASRLAGRPGAAVAAGAVGLAAGAGKLAFDALVQRDAPHAVQGRQFARFEAAFQLAWVVGALLPVLLTVALRQGLALLVAVGWTTAVGYGVQRR